jgi:hypothetical protein
MKRHLLGQVRTGFANPVRGGFDHCGTALLTALSCYS